MQTQTEHSACLHIGRRQPNWKIPSKTLANSGNRPVAGPKPRASPSGLRYQKGAARVIGLNRFLGCAPFGLDRRSLIEVYKIPNEYASQGRGGIVNRVSESSVACLPAALLNARAFIDYEGSADHATYR